MILNYCLCLKYHLYHSGCVYARHDITVTTSYGNAAPAGVSCDADGRYRAYCYCAAGLETTRAPLGHCGIGSCCAII